jgi:hypothetical protein
MEINNKTPLKILSIIMAKGSKGASNSMKVQFGKRKSGKASKGKNKHARKVSKYRGQGR